MLMYKAIFMTRELKPADALLVPISNRDAIPDALRVCKNFAKLGGLMIMSTNIIEVEDEG